MALSPTTIEVVTAAVAQALLDTLPTHVPSRAMFPWRYTANDKVDGGTPRVFTIDWEVESITEGTVHGANGVGMVITMVVAVPYSGLLKTEREAMIIHDSVDVLRAVHPLPSGGVGSLDGLVQILNPRTQVLEDDPANFVVGYTFDMEILFSDQDAT